MGMSSIEWSRYMREEHYRRAPPWIDGALEAVRRIGARWPLGLATSSNREIIDLVNERGRGFDKRLARRPGRRHARHRDPKSGTPAGRAGTARGPHGAGVDRRADTGDRRRYMW
jgi:hypothetical protein